MVNLEKFKMSGIGVSIAPHKEIQLVQCLIFTIPSEGFITAICFDSRAFINPAFWETIADKVKTLMFNRIKFEDIIFKNEEELIRFIESNIPKYTPEEKSDILLQYLRSNTLYDGATYDLKIVDILMDETWRKFYFINANEMFFYVDNLLSNGLLSCGSKTTEVYWNLGLTLKGLSKIAKLSTNKDSRICFVAMSFDKSLEEVYENGIKAAIFETGFIPFIINREDVKSDITINDAIISGIKKAAFTIADFTQHKKGVYFEAGFALGRGQTVIYTCRKDEIDVAHFDTRNYQHIVWETHIDLKVKLIDKIRAVILK